MSIARETLKMETVRLPEWARKHLVGDWVPLRNVWVGDVTISPASAAYILEHHNNKPNRPTIPAHVLRLTHVIEEDQFRMNYQTIQFDRDGDLRDGRNRLTACVRAGKPVEVLAIYGVEEDVFRRLDQGAKRTYAHVLGMEGEQNANALASAIGLLYSFLQTGKVYRADTNLYSLLSIDDCRTHIDLHPGLRESVAFVANSRTAAGLLSGSALPATLHYLFACHDRNLAGSFFSVFNRMARSEIGSRDLPPEWQSMRLLVQAVQTNKSATRKIDQRTMSHLIVQVWNYIHECKEVKLLRIPNAFVPYPRIAGWVYDDEGRPLEATPPTSKATVLES